MRSIYFLPPGALTTATYCVYRDGNKGLGTEGHCSTRKWTVLWSRRKEKWKVANQLVYTSNDWSPPQYGIKGRRTLILHPLQHFSVMWCPTMTMHYCAKCQPVPMHHYRTQWSWPSLCLTLTRLNCSTGTRPPWHLYACREGGTRALSRYLTWGRFPVVEGPLSLLLDCCHSSSTVVLHLILQSLGPIESPDHLGLVYLARHDTVSGGPLLYSNILCNSRQ
jgi:hypothetical protein